MASWVLLSVGSAAAATAVVLYALGFIRTNRGQEPQVALLPSPTGVGIAARW